MTTSADLSNYIGRYQILERIGAGGMARVYKAWDTNLDRSVAIKVLHDHLAEDVTFKERFDREAKLVASLSHPNIVQIYDYGMIDQPSRMLSYMVMPYIAGQTLKDVLDELAHQGKRLERKRILSIMLNLTEALSYAHARGMVHRDVKPGNVLFNEQGQAVLMDFGIARLAQSAQITQEGATVGTPAYLSPEQAAGLPLDSRADLYALGIILYEMLTGAPPFTGESTLSIILKHLNEPVPSLADRAGITNPDLEAIILKALAKSANDRYQTADEFAAELNRVLGGSMTPVPANKATQSTVSLDASTVRSVVQPPMAKKQPDRLTRAVIGVSAAVVVLLVGLFIVTRTPAPATITPETTISSMTGDEGTYFTSSFAPDDLTNSGWPQTAEGSVLRQITADGFYRFENRMPRAAATSIFTPNYTYEDGTITLEGTLDVDSPPTSGYGIVFRYVDVKDYHVFAVDGVGRYSIWRLNDGTWTELRGADENWTASNFINPAGKSNQLTLSFFGDHLVGSVNGQVLVDLAVDAETVQRGAVGLYLATPQNDDRPAILMADTYQISEDVPSMTGG